MFMYNNIEYAGVNECLLMRDNYTLPENSLVYEPSKLTVHSRKSIRKGYFRQNPITIFDIYTIAGSTKSN